MQGLHDLEVIIVGLFRELALSAQKQAEIVVHNAHTEIGGTLIDPQSKNPVDLDAEVKSKA